MTTLWPTIKKNFYLIAAAITLLALATTIAWLVTGGKIKSGSDNLSDFIKTIGAGLTLVVVLGPWAIWVYWPYKTAHKPKEKEVAKSISWNRVKKTGWVVIVTGGVGLAVWGGYRTFILSKSKEAMTIPGSTIAFPRVASTASSRVTTKTIIAPPDGFSKMVSIPPSHWFRWDAETDGCYQIKNGRGEIRKSCGGEHVYLGDRASLLDAMLSFSSLTGSEITVIVEWEPK